MKVLAASSLLFFCFALEISGNELADPTPPLCTSDSECETDEACSSGFCVDPCPSIQCGKNSVCVTWHHVASCMCNDHFTGDPFTECSPKPPECTTSTDCAVGDVCKDSFCILQECENHPCGLNAFCTKVATGEPLCVCDLSYMGDPNTECLPVTLPTAISSKNTQATESYKKPLCAGNLFPQPVGKKNYYVISTFMANWHNAFQYCVSHGMQFATVESEEENQQVLDEIAKTGISNEGFYISGTDYAYEKHWMWMTTGLPINNFSYWHNHRPIYNLVMNCLEYREHDKTNGYRWFDNYCYYTTKRYFICQDYV